MSSKLSGSIDPTRLPVWQELAAAASRLRDSGTRIRQLLDLDAQRVQRYSIAAAGLRFDYSRHLLDDAARVALLQLARNCGFGAAVAALFAGETVNNTEGRAALHVALRSPYARTPEERDVQAALQKMGDFAAAVQDGRWTGYRGKTITDVVNIGIGGSDLGPAMVYEALAPVRLPQLRCHFVSNVDPVHLEQTLQALDPARTLFVIASKTFTTLETILNANAARAWLLASGASQADLARHFVAVSSKVDKAVAFGIAAVNVFPMWDWVGGRYSLWSAIGLPLVLGLGMPAFRALLAGAHAMDEHFRTAPVETNMPLLMALLNLWYTNFFGAQSKVILPYAQNLQLLPAFLQQLDMESLGKGVRRDGSTLGTDSGSILWGSAGTNGQHSFHQLLHQGSLLIPADFIAVLQSHGSQREQHLQLLANCLAQSQALMDGKSAEAALQELLAQGLPHSAAAALAPHKAIPGNRPSSTIVLQKLTPEALGALLALYEHKVYAHSVLLGINAFDQWGVELGKVLGTGVYAALTAPAECGAFDASTNALVNLAREVQAQNA
ncbi:MAG: glucose-6-phosphate isomerase [Pseudohongiellaceae bacterium]